MSALDASPDQLNSSFDQDFFERQTQRLSTLFSSLQHNIKQMEVDMMDTQSMNSASSNVSFEFTNTANTVIPNMVSKLDQLQNELHEYNNIVSNAHTLEEENAKLKSTLSQIVQQYPESQYMINQLSINQAQQKSPQITTPNHSPPLSTTPRTSTPPLNNTSQQLRSSPQLSLGYPSHQSPTNQLSSHSSFQSLQQPIVDTPKYQQLLRELHSVQQQLLSTQQVYDDLKHTHNELTISTTIQIQQQLNDLDQFSDKCTQYKNDLTATQQHVSTLNNNIHQLEQDRLDLISQLNASISSQQDFIHLQQQFIILKRDHDQHSNQSQALQISNNQLTQQLLQLQPVEGQYNSLLTMHEQLQHENDSLKIQLQQLNQSELQLKSKCDQYEQSTIPQLQSTLESTQTSNTELLTQLSQLKNEASISKQQLNAQNDSTQKLTLLQSQYDQLLNDYKSTSSTATSAEVSINQLQLALSRSQTQHAYDTNQFETQLSTTAQSHQQLQDQISRYHQQTQHLQTQIQHLQQQQLTTSPIVSNIEHIQLLEQQLTSTTAKNDSLQVQLQFTINELVLAQDRALTMQLEKDAIALTLKEYSSIALPVPAHLIPTRIGESIPLETLELIHSLENELEQAKQTVISISTQTQAKLDHTQALLQEHEKLSNEQREIILQLKHDLKQINTSSNSAIDQNVLELETKNKHHQDNIDALSTTIDSLTARLTIVQTELVDKEDQLSNSHLTISSLDETLRNTKEQLRTAISHQSLLQEQLQIARSSPASPPSTQQLSSPTTQQQQQPLSTYQKVQYDKQIKTWQTRAVKSKEMLLEKVQELQLVTQQFSLVVDRLDLLTTSHKELQEQHGQCKFTPPSSSQRDQDINEGNHPTIITGIPQDQYDQLHSQYQLLQSEHTILTTQLSSLQTLHHDIKQHHDDIKQHHDEYQSILQHLQKLVQIHTQSSDIIQFEQLVEFFESFFPTQTGLLSQCQNEIQRQKHIVYDMESKYSTLYTEYGELKQKLNVTSENLGQIQSDYQQLMHKYDILEQSHTSLISISPSNDSTELLESTLAEKCAVEQLHNEEYLQLMTKCTEFEQLIISLQSEISGYESTQHDLSVLTDKYESLAPKYQDLASKHDELNDKAAQCDGLLEKVDALTTQFTSLGNDLHDSKKSHRDLQLQFDELNTEYLSIKSENSRLVIQVNNMSTLLSPPPSSLPSPVSSNTNSSITSNESAPNNTPKIPCFSTLPLPTQKLFMQSMIEALITSNEHTRPLVIANIMNMMEFAQTDRERILKRQSDSLLSDNERRLVEKDLQQDRDELVDQLDVIGKGIMFIDSAWAWFNTPVDPSNTRESKLSPVIISNADGTTTLVEQDGTTITLNLEEYQEYQNKQQQALIEEENLFNKVSSSWINYLSSDVDKVVEEQNRIESKNGTEIDESAPSNDVQTDPTKADPLTGWVTFLLGDVAKVVGDETNIISTNGDQTIVTKPGDQHSPPHSSHAPIPQSLSYHTSAPQSQHITQLPPDHQPLQPLQQSISQQQRQLHGSDQIYPPSQYDQPPPSQHQQSLHFQLSPSTLQPQISPSQQTFTYQQQSTQQNRPIMPPIYQRPIQPESTPHTGVYNLFNNDLDIDLDLDA